MSHLQCTVYLIGRDVVEALKMCIRDRTGTVKVAVLDERMPDMNGTDLFKKIHQINPKIKAVPVSYTQLIASLDP